MNQLTIDMYSNCIKGNSIFISKNLSENDFKLRHRYLMLAKGSVEALRTEISFCYSLIEPGENFLGSAQDKNNAFERWSKQAWKASTIHFETDLVARITVLHLKLLADTRYFTGFHSFTTIEHGKVRNIDALPIDDRALQKCLCTYLLARMYSRRFIADNAASLKDKGMDYQLNRLKKHLHDYFRKYGTEGGIYQLDFKSYFDSIPHSEVKRRARYLINDDKVYKIFCQLVDEFQLRATADKSGGPPHEVGLGSEVSQIIALDYANPIDHYVKEVYHIHGYGRYMDDGYVISDSIELLEEIRDTLYKIAAEMGIKMSDKKNIITPFKHHSLHFLKMRIRLTNTGKVVMKLNRKSIRAMRRIKFKCTLKAVKTINNTWVYFSHEQDNKEMAT